MHATNTRALMHDDIAHETHMLALLSCINIIKVVALPSIATKAKAHTIEVVVHMQTHFDYHTYPTICTTN